jgi:hypothetical protein
LYGDAVILLFIVMAGLVPAIHAFLLAFVKTWMPATSAGMTTFDCVLFY